MSSRAPMLPRSQPLKGTIHIQTEWCKGCELCIDYCPTKVLALSTEFNAKGYHYPVVVDDNCISCQGCFTICPEFCIFPTPFMSARRRAEALSSA